MPHATEEAVEAVLERLVELGMQSDRRYAEAHVHAHHGRHGRLRLAYDLKQAGLDSALIDEVLAQTLPDDERARAVAVWKRRFGAQRPEGKAWAKQARFLLSRGFDAPTVSAALAQVLADTETEAPEPMA